MNKVNIIGLSGPAFVGKTTIADSLTGYTKRSYAEPLKTALTVLTGLPEKTFYDKDEKLIPRDLFNGKTSREVMQLFGTEFCRHMIAEDFWLKLMSKKLTEHPHTKFVIDDVRFDDEADLIRSLGGVVVELARDGVEYANDHASEAGVVADMKVVLPSGTYFGTQHFLKEMRGFGIL